MDLYPDIISLLGIAAVTIFHFVCVAALQHVPTVVLLGQNTEIASQQPQQEHEGRARASPPTEGEAQP